MSEEKKSFGYADEDIVKMLGDIVGTMRIQLDKFVKDKKLNETSSVVKERRRIVSTLMEIYYFLSNDVYTENISARKRIREFSEALEEFILEDGRLPKELLTEQITKFDEIWGTVREINEETRKIAERRKIKI